MLSLVQKKARQSAKNQETKSGLKGLLQQEPEDEDAEEKSDEKESPSSSEEAEKPSTEETDEPEDVVAEIKKAAAEAKKAEEEETTTLELNTTTTSPDFYKPQIPAGAPTNTTTTLRAQAPKSTRPPTTMPPLAVEPSIADKISFKGCLAEIVVMALYVLIGCGSQATSQGKEGSAWVLQVSLTFGLANACLSYSVDHWKAGNLNLVTTLCLMFLGQVGYYHGAITIFCQLFGSCVGAFILSKMIPVEKDCSEGLGHNVVQPGYKNGQVLVLEAAMSFILMFVTLQAALNPDALSEKILARLSVGFMVFVGNSVLVPIDGCSMNPSRSFGPAYVAKYVRGQTDAFVGWWVFWMGPIMGGLLGACCFRLFADDLWWTLYS